MDKMRCEKMSRIQLVQVRLTWFPAVWKSQGISRDLAEASAIKNSMRISEGVRRSDMFSQSVSLLGPNSIIGD